MSQFQNALSAALNNEELLDKVRNAKTIDEISALAKKQGYDISDDEIRSYLASGNVDSRLIPMGNHDCNSYYCSSHKN